MDVLGDRLSMTKKWFCRAKANRVLRVWRLSFSFSLEHTKGTLSFIGKCKEPVIVKIAIVKSTAIGNGL